MFTENVAAAMHLLPKSLKKNRQEKNGVERKAVEEAGAEESESKNTKVNPRLTSAQMIRNQLIKEGKASNQPDLQRIYNYPQNWQLLLAQVKLLGTRL